MYPSVAGSRGGGGAVLLDFLSSFEQVLPNAPDFEIGNT